MGGFWTTVANTAFAFAVRTDWLWLRRVESWAWHRANVEGEPVLIQGDETKEQT